MTRSKTRQLVIALIFAIFMTGFFWISANADPASAITVTVQAENDNGGFIIEPKEIEVTAGYADYLTDGSYYNDYPASNSDVTALDELFAAHADCYGNDFDDESYGDFIDGSASYITTMFEIEAGSGNDGFPGIMFVVNGVQPNDGVVQQWPDWTGQGLDPTYGYTTYAMNQSVVSEGDVVNFFFINSYNDIYTFINRNNTDLLGFDGYNTTFNTTDTLIFKGYDVFTRGYMVRSLWQDAPLVGATVYDYKRLVTVGTLDNNGSISFNDSQVLNNLVSGDNYLTIIPSVSNVNYIPISFKVHK